MKYKYFLLNIAGCVEDLVVIILLMFLLIANGIVASSIGIFITIFITVITKVFLHKICEYEEGHSIHVVTTVLFILMSCWCSFIALSGLVQADVIAGLTNTTEAKIIDIAVRDKKVEYLKLVAEDGSRYTVTLHDNYVGAIGDTVQIKYNPKDADCIAYSTEYSADMSLFKAILDQPNPRLVQGGETNDING